MKLLAVAVVIASAILGYAIALPRYQTDWSDNGRELFVHDRFFGELYICSSYEGLQWSCLRIDPRNAMRAGPEDVYSPHSRDRVRPL